MQLRKDRWQGELFMASSLEDLIPEYHVLRRVDGVLDLSWLHDALRDCYSQERGRGSIDPESALRLMLAGFLEGIVHDRALLRRAQTDIAFRWFAGYRLDEKLPDHSTMTRIRQRWGRKRFEEIFVRTVAACVAADLVEGKTIHVDATLIRADVSWESLTHRHVEEVLRENGAPELQAESEDGDRPPPGSVGNEPKPPKGNKRSATDPDATMATRSQGQHLEPSYKQHTAVDDKAGVIVDVALTTGNVHEGTLLMEQLDRVAQRTGVAIEAATGDKSYAHAANYQRLEEQNIAAVIPPQKVARTKRIPGARFKYDPIQQHLRCPGGKQLPRKGYSKARGGYRYSASAQDCKACPLRDRCLPKSQTHRTILIRDGHEALLRARRYKARGWDEVTKERYRRHRWRVEGVHGQGKTQHGLRRAVRRGEDNVAIQVFLSACAVNLKKLAKSIAGKLENGPIRRLRAFLRRSRPQTTLNRGRFTRKRMMNLAA